METHLSPSAMQEVQQLGANHERAAGNVVRGSWRARRWMKESGSVGHGAPHRATQLFIPLYETGLAPSVITVTFSEELCQPQWEEVKFQGCY